MKIIAVGMNYPLHCKELHAEEPLPEEPVIFMKPDSALLNLRHATCNAVSVPKASRGSCVKVSIIRRLSATGYP